MSPLIFGQPTPAVANPEHRGFSGVKNSAEQKGLTSVNSDLNPFDNSHVFDNHYHV